MYVLPLDGSLGEAHRLITEALAVSRFRCDIETEDFYRPRLYPGLLAVLRLRCIRMKRKKPYCGQHAGPCQARFSWRKHPVMSLLEGADWIGWNAMLNDIFDAAGMSVDIWSRSKEGGLDGSGRFFVRKGRRRRMIYDGEETRGVFHWAVATEADFEDYCGETPPETSYPAGTPGIALWRAEEARELEDQLCKAVHEH